MIFSLCRNFDYFTIRYLFSRFRFSKKSFIHLNFYNIAGYSPLFLAVSLWKREKQLFPNRFRKMNKKRGNVKNKHKKKNKNWKHKKALQLYQRSKYKKDCHMYEFVLSNGADPNLPIKRDGSTSILGYAFAEIGDLRLIEDLTARGCVLNIKEIPILTQLYLEYACSDCEMIERMSTNARVAARVKAVAAKKRDEAGILSGASLAVMNVGAAVDGGDDRNVASIDESMDQSRIPKV